MDINEFIDTYSDDMIYLREARSALLTHPLRTAVKEYLDASICRLLAVFMIGNIEAMLKAWCDKRHVRVLHDVYFPKKKRENGEKVSALCKAFLDAGIEVDKRVLDDYLAIKYLRNAIVHGEWRETEREWLEKQGFPTDSRKLTKAHLDKIGHVNQNMMFYIFLASQPSPAAGKPSKLVKLEEAVTRQSDETGILLNRDIDRVIWNSLERIDEFIYADLERAAISDAYNWTGGRERSEIEALGSGECKRLYYLAARRAGEENYEPLARHRPLAAEALAIWREYWRRTVATRGLDEARVVQALDVLQHPQFARVGSEVPFCSVLHNMPEDAARQLVDAAFGDSAPFTGEQVVNAFRAGHVAWELIPNMTPVSLFTLRLPIVDPANTATYLQEASRALRVFKLNRAWYSWVEHQRPPTGADFEFYERMQQEFAGRSL